MEANGLYCSICGSSQLRSGACGSGHRAGGILDWRQADVPRASRGLEPNLKLRAKQLAAGAAFLATQRAMPPARRLVWTGGLRTPGVFSTRVKVNGRTMAILRVSRDAQRLWDGFVEMHGRGAPVARSYGHATPELAMHATEVQALAVFIKAARLLDTVERTGAIDVGSRRGMIPSHEDPYRPSD